MIFSDFLQIDLGHGELAPDLDDFINKRRSEASILKINFSARSLSSTALVPWTQALATNHETFLISNGFYLNDPTLKNVLEAPLTRLGFYLESLRPQLQESLRPGESLDKIQHCFERLKSSGSGVSTAIYTHILEQNYQEIAEIVDFAIRSPLIDACMLLLLAPETPEELALFHDGQSEFSGRPATRLIAGTITKIIQASAPFTTLQNPLQQLNYYQCLLEEQNSQSPRGFSDLGEIPCCQGRIFSKLDSSGLRFQCSAVNPDNFQPGDSGFTDLHSEISKCAKSCHYKLNHHQPTSGVTKLFEGRSSIKSLDWEPPRSLCITLSETCNLKCKMCYNWKKRVPISAGYYLAIRNFLYEFSERVEMPYLIVLAGAEPLLDPELDGLLQTCSNLGFQTQIVTNGILLDKKRILELKKMNLKVLTLPLEGVSEDIHNQLRPRNFKLVWDRIALLQEFFPELEVHINTVISDLNFHEMASLANQVQEHPFLRGIYFNIVVQPFASSWNPNWYENERERALWPGANTQLLEVLEDLRELKLRGCKIDNPPSQFTLFKTYLQNPLEFVHSKCPVNSEGMILKSNGDLCHCPYFPLSSLGNILTQTLDEIIWTHQAKFHRQLMQDCKTNCHLCVNCFSGCSQEDPQGLQYEDHRSRD